MKKAWSCKIGHIDEEQLPDGSDALLREAVARAYRELTGQYPTFLFSGWGAKLSDEENEVVERQKSIGV